MLTDAKKQELEQTLKGLLEQADVIDAAVVVTVDGHLQAMAQKQDYPLERVAAMGSSFMSLGDTITAELKMGVCRNIISENESGIIVFMHINDSMILVSMTTDTSALGLLLSHSRIHAQKMQNML